MRDSRAEATDAQDRAVRFYDSHPINEQQILHDLERDGVALDGLTEDVLQNYDQDHFGGLEAVDVLAAKAGIDAASHVLDVCSGMGGPARYLREPYRLPRHGARHHAKPSSERDPADRAGQACSISWISGTAARSRCRSRTRASTS